MNFAEAREVFLRPRTGAATPAVGTPALRLRHVLEPLAMASVWSAPAHEHLAAAGLDFLSGYVGGRACVLGDPSPGVVAAAFAVFEPGLVGELWRQARAAAEVEDLRRIRELAGGEGLRAALEGVDVAEVGREPPSRDHAVRSPAEGNEQLCWARSVDTSIASRAARPAG